jgi:hypothetical protein
VGSEETDHPCRLRAVKVRRRNHNEYNSTFLPEPAQAEIYKLSPSANRPLSTDPVVDLQSWPNNSALRPLGAKTSLSICCRVEAFGVSQNVICDRAVVFPSALHMAGFVGSA